MIHPAPRPSARARPAPLLVAALGVLVALAAACGKGDDTPPDIKARCDRFAMRERACVEDIPDKERAVFESMSRDYCRKALSGKHDEIFGVEYKAKLACAEPTDTDCDQYRRCREGGGVVDPAAP